MGTSSPNFDVARNIRLVPRFNEREVEKYFLHFEKIAESMKWPKDVWSLMLQSVLTGKAQETYSSLSVEQCSKYDIVKNAVLKCYELVPEAYRQKFRNSKKIPHQTFVEFAKYKEQLFDRWCLAMHIDNDFGKLRQLLLLEEFKRSVSPEIRTYLNEKDITELCHASVAADDYTLTHKSSYGKNLLETRGARHDQLSGTGSNHVGEQPKYNSIGIHEHNSVRNPNGNNAKNYQVPVKKPFDESQKYYGPKCTYCHKRGHTISKCWKLQQESGSKPVGVVGYNCGNILLSSCHDSGAMYHSGDTPMCYDIPVPDVGSNCGNTLLPSCPESDAIHNSDGSNCGNTLLPSCPDYDVIHNYDGSNCGNTLLPSCLVPEEIRDHSDGDPGINVGSNCGNTLLPSCHGSNVMREHSNAALESYAAFLSSGSVSLVGIPAIQKNITILRDTGASQSLLLESVMPFPSSRSSVLIQGIDSRDYSSVPLHMIKLSKLPIRGVDMLLGNDIAGDKVVPVPQLTDDPVQSSPDDLAIRFPSTFPSCVVTRSMAKQRNLDHDMTLDDTFMTNIDGMSDRNSDSPSVSSANSSVDVQMNHDGKIIHTYNTVSQQRQRIADQHADPDIDLLFDLALTEEEAKGVPVCYFVRSGLLMRKWRPPDISADMECCIKLLFHYHTEQTLSVLLMSIH